MPNWITNVVEAPEHVIDAMLDNEGMVDFNNIIPTPEDVFQGALGNEEKRKYPGEKNWYGFNIANWGTKWNASGTVRVSPTKINFDTAWSNPIPIFVKLSEMFPEENIYVAYADEDLGHNCGAYKLNNGEITYILNIEYGSSVACEFSSLIIYDVSYSSLLEEEVEAHNDYPEEQSEYEQRLEEHNENLNNFKNMFPNIDLTNFVELIDMEVVF